MSKVCNNESSSFYQVKEDPFVIEHEPAAELTSDLSTTLSGKETDCLLLLISFVINSASKTASLFLLIYYLSYIMEIL